LTGAVPRRSWRPVDGLLLLDKPVGITSTAALQRARRTLQAEKAGHTGTLDPLASGLLPLCFGQATKFAQFLLDADKRYRARVALGLTTSTGDAEGEPLERRPVAVNVADLEPVLARFRGAIQQVPPMHSALKRDGRPLYELARAGQTVDRAARPVEIFALDLLDFDGVTMDLDVHCSKGTYIRVLAEDIGAALGCGAHLAALQRTATSGWTLAQSVALADLEALDEGAAEGCLLPPALMVSHLPALHLDDPQLVWRLSQGQRLALSPQAPAAAIAVWDAAAADPRFLGVVSRDADGVLHPIRLMASTAVSRPS